MSTITWNNKTVLVIAPHADDEVIGCGGLIHKIKSAGGNVYVLYMTNGTSKDFNGNGASTKPQREKEIKRVAAFLRFDGWRIAFPGNKYHLKLDQVPQKDIIHEIERGKKISLEALKPDIIAFPQFGDYNQDHRATAEATFAACRPAPRKEKFIPSIILSYEGPHSVWSHPSTNQQPNMFIELSKEDVEKKIRGMELYASQVRSPGHPRHTETLRALAVVRGSMIGSAFAEGYYCHKHAG